METKPVHVVSLTATNVKKIKAARVEPDPAANLVLIGGANDQGKSSLLDAMIAVFGGKDASPERAVRKGAKKGEVIVDLGDLVAKLRFTAAGGRELIVEDKEGNKKSSPQAVMDALTGKIGFDAEEFIRRRPDDQLAVLRKIVGIDFKAIDDRRKVAYDARTLANAEVDRLKVQLASAPNPNDAPAELVDTTAVLLELKTANEANAKKQPLVDAYNSSVQDYRLSESDVANENKEMEATSAKVTRLENELSEARAQLKLDIDSTKEAVETALKVRKERDDAKAAVDAFVVVDVAPIQAKLAGADAQNTKVRQAASRKAIATSLREAEAKAQGLSNKIDAADTEKQMLMENAKFPVQGLSFTETGILFDGVPFSQASSSTKRRVSVAIGAALNPKLRVMVVKDGSLLDAKSMEQLRELAAEHDLQVWVEVVTSGPDARCAVIIEDGEVVGAPKVEDIPEPAEKSSTVTDNAPEPPADLFGALPPQ